MQQLLRLRQRWSWTPQILPKLDVTSSSGVCWPRSVKRNSISTSEQRVRLFTAGDNVVFINKERYKGSRWIVSRKKSCAPLHRTNIINSYLVFRETHAGISAVPLSTSTAAFSSCHVCTARHDKHNFSQVASRTTLSSCSSWDPRLNSSSSYFRLDCVVLLHY